tara:strand:+ start:1902 stop:2123 length:222 start_codon:yes stop_codon:yes gene_type:complete
MKGRSGKRTRRESAIKKWEEVIASHKAGDELVRRVLEDKGLEDKTNEEVEKLRLKKLQRAETSLENTKKLLNS